jgi:hypothetical protein
MDIIAIIASYPPCRGPSWFDENRKDWAAFEKKQILTCESKRAWPSLQKLCVGGRWSFGYVRWKRLRVRCARYFRHLKGVNDSPPSMGLPGNDVGVAFAFSFLQHAKEDQWKSFPQAAVHVVLHCCDKSWSWLSAITKHIMFRVRQLHKQVDSYFVLYSRMNW